MRFLYITDRLWWCSVFIGADRCHKRLLRVSELLWRLFWGSSCCQRPPEVRRSGRLVSLSSSLSVLLGHAAALLQRNQRVHRRDRGPDRLPRPAQEGQNKLKESDSFRFVSVRGNTVSCQTTERMKLFLFQWRVCVQMLFSSSGKSPNPMYSWQLWYETKRYVNENQYFHQVVFARSCRSMYVHDVADFLSLSCREEDFPCPSSSRRSRPWRRSRSGSPGSGASRCSTMRPTRWWAGPDLRSGGLMWPTLRWWWRWRSEIRVQMGNKE